MNHAAEVLIITAIALTYFAIMRKFFNNNNNNNNKQGNNKKMFMPRIIPTITDPSSKRKVSLPPLTKSQKAAKAAFKRQRKARRNQRRIAKGYKKLKSH